MRELVTLPYFILLNLLNHLYNFGLYLVEIFCFYRNPRLLKYDVYWMLEYALRSPFSMSQKYTQDQALERSLTTYGETPWFTLKKIFEPHLQAHMTVFELGAGTGRTLLFLKGYFGADVVGFELIQPFVHKFQWLKHVLKLEGVDMRQGDWMKTDLSEGDLFLLVGTCYSDGDIVAAQQALRKVKKGAIIITTSWSLDHEVFECVSEEKCYFSWGRGTVYTHTKVV